MKYTLRKYQKEASDRAYDFFTNDDIKYNAIEILPTGAGKSLIIADLAHRLGSVLIFQPRKEILEQNYSKYLAFGNKASIYSASAGYKDVGDVTFATIGSAIKHPEMFRHFKYLIVDECHYVNSKAGMYKQFLDIIPSKVLGVTATPYRLNIDGYGGAMLKFLTRTRPRVFKDVLYSVQTRDLLNDGYLNPVKYYPLHVIDNTKLVVNSTGQDYTDKSLIAHYETIGFNNKLLEIVNRLIKAGRNHILVFTRFVKEAEYCTSKIEASAMVSGKTPKKEREDILDKFKSGDIKVVFNAMVLTVGFDFPELDTVVLGRDTRSLALYYQIIGRGIRIAKDKGDTWVIDLGNSFLRFGDVYDLNVSKDKRGNYIITNYRGQITNIYIEN